MTGRTDTPWTPIVTCRSLRKSVTAVGSFLVGHGHGKETGRRRLRRTVVRISALMVMRGVGELIV